MAVLPVKCSKCGELMVAHQVCKSCGAYNKKQIIDDVDNLIAVRIIEYIGGIDIPAAVIISQDSFDQITDLFAYVLLHIHVSLSQE